MDTPVGNGVLLSGLVYTRARVTSGPWLNRRGEEYRQGVWVFTRMLLTTSPRFLSFHGMIRDNGKIVSTRPSHPHVGTLRRSILFQNDDPILARCVNRRIPRLDPTGCCFHYILQNNCKRESDLCRRVTTVETH